jgi:hypothetical protein
VYMTPTTTGLLVDTAPWEAAPGPLGAVLPPLAVAGPPSPAVVADPPAALLPLEQAARATAEAIARTARKARPFQRGVKYRCDIASPSGSANDGRER